MRETVTTPMLGQIRLQWWREVIEAAYSGGAGAAARGRTAAGRGDRGVRAVARAFRPDHRRARARSRRHAAGRSRGADRLCRGYLVARWSISRWRLLGAAEPAAVAGGARGRDRLCAGRAVAGDAVSRRFRTLVHPAGCRGAGRARSGSLCAVGATRRRCAKRPPSWPRRRRRISRRHGAARGQTSRRALAGLVAGGDRRPVSAAAETGRVQPVRARTGRARPAAKLAACRGGAAQPVLIRSAALEIGQAAFGRRP